jgi:LacI family transcriptional regulator
MISFGDSDVGRFISPSLSCVSQPTQELGTRAVQMVLEMIQKSDLHGEHHEEIQTELILRDTCIRHNGYAQHHELTKASGKAR